MKNEKGSLLVITTTFILAFTLLGLGAIHWGTMQNTLAEKEKFSSAAFWLADGAVERARWALPGTLFSPGQFVDIPAGDGVYDVASQRAVKYDEQGNIVYTYLYRWLVDTRGEVRGEERRIHAEVGAFNNRFSLITRGTIKNFEPCPPASVTLECELVVQNASFDLNTYFNGLNEADIFGMATRTYVDPANAGDVNPIEQITVIQLQDRNTININTNNIVPNNDPIFLIVDTRAASSNPNNPPSLRIDGNVAFNGIIWVIGEASFTGTAAVHGTIFVQGNPAWDTTILGNFTVLFDDVAAESAVSYLGGGNSLYLPQTPRIEIWREI